MKKIFFIVNGLLMTLLLTAQTSPFHNDKSTAKKLCNKNQYTEPQLYGCGSSIENEESHSAWYTFEIATPGTLEFIIEPLVANDDIDFLLEQIYFGNSDFPARVYTGAFMRGGVLTRFGTLEGDKTGAKNGVNVIGTFVSNFGGGGGSKTSFAKTVNTYAGAIFNLRVNNYFNNNGFKITWGGTCSFVACTQNKEASSNTIIKPQLGEIFPNPTFDKIHLDVDFPLETNTILRILDLQGREMFQQTETVQHGIHRFEIDVAEFPRGAYILELINDKKDVYGKRFLKLD